MGIVDWFEEHARGRENARRRVDVADALGFSIRSLKIKCEALRLAGVPILYSTDAQDGGIFLAATPQEVREGIDKLERLALSVLRERSALKRALACMEEKASQRELFA